MNLTDPARSYWNRHATNYDRSMLLLGRPIPRMLQLVAEAVRGRARVLEVAGGTGIITPVLAREAAAVVATDYAEEMVAAIAARVTEGGFANVEVRQADLYALPFEPASFDAVVAANVLHLIPDLPGAFASFRGVLRGGGKLVVPTFCHDETRRSWLLSRALAVTGFPQQRRFTVRSLRVAVEAEGLHVTRAETLPGLIPIGYLEGRFRP